MGEDEHGDDTNGPDDPGDETEPGASPDDGADVPTPDERAGPDPISGDDEPGDADTDAGGEALLGGRISPAQRQRAERALTWILAIALALSLAGVVYVALVPPETGSTFSEFYLLGPNGNASEYPTTLRTNETGTVIVGISNHERKSVEYRVRVTWNGTQAAERTVSVADGDTREFRMNLTAPADPGRYRVRFLLYNETGSEPYLRTRLWIQVRNESAVRNGTTPDNVTAPNGTTGNTTTPGEPLNTTTPDEPLNTTTADTSSSPSAPQPTPTPASTARTPTAATTANPTPTSTPTPALDDTPSPDG